jgi:hypothetical protein
MFEQSLAKKQEFIKKKCLDSLICKNQVLLKNKNKCCYSLGLKNANLLKNNRKCLDSLLLEIKVLLNFIFNKNENSRIRLCEQKSLNNYFILFGDVWKGERHHLTPPVFYPASLKRGGLI